MKTTTRLSEAYEGARIELIDDSSRYVIMSDCHRGDGSKSDEFLKNKNTYTAALDYYWRSGFTYVEAGDGDELWEHDFKHIIRANRAVWEQLLPFHRAGRFIRMWGNHDFALADPQFVRQHLWNAKNVATGEPEPFFDGLEPVEAVVFRVKETGQDILLVHGHQGDLPNDQAWRFSRFMMRRSGGMRTRSGSTAPPAPWPTRTSGTRWSATTRSGSARTGWPSSAATPTASGSLATARCPTSTRAAASTRHTSLPWRSRVRRSPSSGGASTPTRTRSWRSPVG